MRQFLFLALLFSGSFAFADRPVVNGAKPVLVIVGMKMEADILAHTQGITVVISAGRPDLLRSRLQRYSSENVRAIISFGVAGALVPSLSVGQLVLATSVTDGRQTWLATPELLSFFQGQFSHLNPVLGPAAATEKIEDASPESRERLHHSTRAIIVDNESQVAAEFATRNHIPFGVIRTIADDYESILPPAAQIPMLDDGTPDMRAISESLTAHPEQFWSLMALSHSLNKAVDTLGICVPALPLYIVQAISGSP